MKKLIGVMLVKNEDWILGMSMRAALKWVDELVIVDDRSWDDSLSIIQEISGENPYRVHYSLWQPMKEVETESRYKPGEKFMKQIPDNSDPWWNEMDVRQHSLLLARKHGATHVAIIDADEAFTANLLPSVRDRILSLEPGVAIDYPMVPVWGDIDQYRADDCVWSRSQLSVAFADDSSLTWKPAGDGYHHHHRLPYGISRVERETVPSGGVMHLQFAHRQRLTEKHVHYKLSEVLRWPGRKSIPEINSMYEQALDENGMKLMACPEKWWEGYRKERVVLEGKSWYYFEIRKLLKEHGKEKFAGLELHGF